MLRVNGRNISIEKIASRTFKLILPFIWSTLQLRLNGMASQTSRLDVTIRVCGLWLWNVLFFPERIDRWHRTQIEWEAVGKLFLWYLCWHHWMHKWACQCYWLELILLPNVLQEPAWKYEIKWKEEELKYSAMGCAICGEPICYVFWLKWYDKHRNNDTA